MVILRSRGQDSGRLSKEGSQRLAMGDPERLSLPPWEKEKTGVRHEPVWLQGDTSPSTVLVLWLSNHKPFGPEVISQGTEQSLDVSHPPLEKP